MSGDKKETRPKVPQSKETESIIKKLNEDVFAGVDAALKEHIPKIKPHLVKGESEGESYDYTFNTGTEKIEFKFEKQFFLDKDKDNSLGDYLKLRFDKESSFITHTFGKIRKFFYGEPYDIREKLQAMELLTGFLNNSLELPDKYQSMKAKDFERVLGALNNGRLKVAVDKYLKVNCNNDNIKPTGVRNVDELISKLKTLKQPEQELRSSPNQKT